MEEDVGIKVTRLRRRLSVEQSEDGSSPGPSTPSKKRGGRLAAKPQLELIEENTPVSSPRKIRRKSLATDAEEKPITPSRRSARIKSNSSIVSETLSVQATDSPRAKRAARRNSQAGSDTEGPVTPARQTRRTRKDSASSVENQEAGTLSKPLPVAEMVIKEEPENEIQKSVYKSSPTTGEELSPNSARKSKRLLEKRNRRSGSYKTDQDHSSGSIENKSLNVSKENVKTPAETRTDLRTSSNKSDKSKESTDYLSESNMSLLNKLEETESKRDDLYHNKSALALDVTEDDKIKRKRTESWQEVVASVTIDSITFSDTELSKKDEIKSNRLRFSGTDYSPKNKSNTSLNENNTSQTFLDISSTRKNRKSESNTDTAKPCEDIATLEVQTPTENINNNEAPTVKTDNTDVTRDMAMLFENPPSNVQATVYFEDSDSNSIGTGTVNKIENIDSEDQRVPEINVTSSAEKKSSLKQLNNDNDKVSSNDINVSNIESADKNNSCEPMDIDETIHEEILQKSLDTIQQSRSECKSLSPHSIVEDPDKRKSSISGLVTDTLDQTKNDTRKLSSSKTSADTPDISENSKRKSDISVNSTDRSRNDERKPSISNTTADSLDNSKNNKRKSSLSNSAEDTLDISKSDKRKTSVSDTPDQSKKDKRTSSISNSTAETPDQSKKDKRTSSISNSAAETPDLSKNDNNKTTLILSQLKDVSTTSQNPKSPKSVYSSVINEVLSKSDINQNGNKNKKMLKDNLSLNEVKVTPKQTSVQKLSMQTSTPITAQQLETKTKIGEQKHATIKKTKSYFSKSINETDSSEGDSDDDDDDPSVEKSKLLDNEADEASDDYESGDSQDEDERRYEAENEIVERGETLTSDDDVSNDTDYEKDSFVVSSDAEDNELLSGSGDDLTMSDNELSMSKKSKKKFNERKQKEQKNASREMFESRHKLNSSDKNSTTLKTKKIKIRIDSSLLASDEELLVKPKKNNRMRLDSTLDTSVKQDEANVSTKKKKDKSMQDSIYNQSDIDEKEITVCNESITANADPLQIQLKQERKTPQKDLNISVVQVQQDIENVQVLESNSIFEQTSTDPLQATMACEDTSDSSGNEEILQNYDSVLNELNKDRKTKLSNNNISLNIDNKSKTSHVEPLIDQLNLTLTKKSKKNKEQSKNDSDSGTQKVSQRKQDSDNEDPSSSIDLQLLFSEDNCGTEDEERMSQQNQADDDNMFFPLKKSPGKTNLRENIEIYTSQQDTTMNNSIKKNKNRKSSLVLAESVDERGLSNAAEPELNESTKKKKRKSSSTAPPEGDIFFVDTTGTLLDDKDDYGEFNESLRSKRKKKKKKDKLHDVVTKTEQNENTLEESNSATTPKSEKKKKKHSLSEPSAEESQENMNEKSNVMVIPKSEKKKKKRSISEPPTGESQGIINVSKTNTSMKESGLKNKKKKHSISVPSVDECQGLSNAVEHELNESTKKKKKRKSSLTAPPEGDIFFVDTTGTLQDNKENTLEASIDATTPKSEKKKKKHSLSEPPAERSQENTKKELKVAKSQKSEKKINKHFISEAPAEEYQGIPDATEPEVTESIKKKKKRKSALTAEPEENTAEESIVIKTPKSVEKKKKLESLVHDDDSDGAPDEAPYQSEKAVEIDLQNLEQASEPAEESSAKKKHKKKKMKKSAAFDQSGASIDTENSTQPSSKKRKRMFSNAENPGDALEAWESEQHNELVGSNKKLKISHNVDTSANSNKEKLSKKNKKKNLDVNFQDTASTFGPTETQVKKNKKRKHRDEDGDSKKTKVSKDNSFQEVHVPRLPESILRQLDDKPRKIEKEEVISTSNFIVENARQKRAKPSNYLEESIYLDEKSPLAKKEKSRIKKPKVLPFIPTASISDSGFTTNFKINKLTQFTAFEAEPVVFSKESYLQNKKIKRLGTYDRYKKQMHHKISKF